MAKSYTCSSLVKDCTWSTTANDTATLMKKIVAHAEFKHDLQLSTGDKIKIQSTIRDR
ncbi:MAG: DUF1059 domain-containing protein [Nitrosopumilus sp.]|nr:DUF1059 domain-containing protein [Nitrosopumilus sp.]